MIAYRELGHHGRLGNALFELAATIGIADERGEQAMFPADWLHRPWFSVPDELFSAAIPDEAVEATSLVTLDHRSRTYLQDTHLFEHSIEKILDYLQPSDLACETLATFELPEHPRLSVHVRRGDKIFDPGVPNIENYFIQPGVNYYLNGIDHFMQRKPHICVFSDDISWCKMRIGAEFYGTGQSYWKEHEPRFGVDTPYDWVDLFLMSQCDYHVVSGSTLGIWGALLADNDPETVLRPDKVYGPELAFVEAELLFNPEWEIMRLDGNAS